MSNDPALGGTLIRADELAGRVVELGALISRDYADRRPLLVGVLKGAFMFLADLTRAMTIDAEVDFMAIASYGAGTQTSGVVRIVKDLDVSIEQRHVLVVEDIVDSGLTLSYLVKSLMARRPATIEICTLLAKPERRDAEVSVRYVGFEIPNRFVVGYGLDYNERYRRLPEITLLAEEP